MKDGYRTTSRGRGGAVRLMGAPQREASIDSIMISVKVNREEPTGLHEQVAAEIRRAIADGEAKPGERLPPAKDLAAVLGVNTNTVLRALRTLRDEELLEFRRGRGITVAGTPVVPWWPERTTWWPLRAHRAIAPTNSCASSRTSPSKRVARGASGLDTPGLLLWSAAIQYSLQQSGLGR